MELLEALPRTANDRSCLLGAGNCNDIELRPLLARFGQVTLVDLDEGACREAVARQLGESSSRVSILPATDVTGLLQIFDDLSSPNPSDAQIREQLLQRLRQTQVNIAGPYDAIASCCLLSQIVDSLVMALGAQSPLLLPVILEMRRQHLLLVARNLVPGGRGLILMDFVSTATLPELMHFSNAELPQQLLAAIQHQNFFTGLNPFAVHAELLNDPGLQALVDQVQLFRPWRWQLPNKAFAVAALRFVRR